MPGNRSILAENVDEGATQFMVDNVDGFEAGQCIALNEGDFNFEILEVSEAKGHTLVVKKPIQQLHRAGEAVTIFRGNPEHCDNILMLDLNEETIVGAQVKINAHIARVTCGNGFTGAITSSGTLLMWGSNTDGQLGIKLPDGATATETPTPVPVPGVVEQLACGYSHTLAIVEDGGVYAWGSGMMGKLGFGHDRDVKSPARVTFKAAGVGRAMRVACGQYSSAAICEVADAKTGKLRRVFCWGNNRSGAIGTGDTNPRFEPTLIDVRHPDSKAPADILDVAMGNTHTGVVVRSGGRVAMWGENDFGQLGYECEDMQLTPRFIDAKELSDVKQLKCGERHTSALTDDGKIYSWGSGETHQIGIMDNVDQYHPCLVKHVRAERIAVGMSASAAFTEEGDVYMWGFSVESAVPIKMPTLRDSYVVTGDLGADSNVAVVTGIGQRIYSCDMDGDESEDTSKVSKFELLRGKRVTNVSCGSEHVLAVSRTGKVVSWGTNTSMQLGTGDEQEQDAPYQIEYSVFAKNGGDAVVVRVVAGYEHSLALTADGRVFSWGSGQMGKLGHGDDGDSGAPRLIESLVKAQVKVSAICAGQYNSGAVSKDGKAYGWGTGASGQLNNGSNSPAFAPTVISLPENGVQQMDFGDRHAVCLTASGAALTWGNNQFGQLGRLDDGKAGRIAKLKDVKVIAIAASEMVTFFLSDKGRVFGCGSYSTLQLGEGVEEDLVVPEPIKFFDDKNIVSLSAAPRDCAAISDKGEVYVWGFTFEEKPQKLNIEEPVADVAVGGDALIAFT